MVNADPLDTLGRLRYIVFPWLPVPEWRAVAVAVVKAATDATVGLESNKLATT